MWCAASSSGAYPLQAQADAVDPRYQSEGAQAYSQAAPGSHREKATFKRHPLMFRDTHAPAVHKSINSWIWVNCEETFNNPPKCSIRAPQRLISLYEVWVIAREAIHHLISLPQSSAAWEAKQGDSVPVYTEHCVCTCTDMHMGDVSLGSEPCSSFWREA